MSRYSFKLKIIAAFVAATFIPFVLSWILFFTSNDYRLIMENGEINISLIIILTIGILLSLFLTIQLINSITKPLNKLIKAAQIVSEGNFDYDVPVEGNDEISFLAHCMRKMLMGLKATFIVLKKRSQELTESNEQLQNINIELEASLEQLRATTEQLNDSEDKYRTLIENITDLVWLVDYEGNIIYVNDKFKQLMDYNESELIGKYIIDILANDVLSTIFEAVKDTDNNRIKIEFLTKEGKILYTETSLKRVEKSGEVIGIQGLSRNITEKVTIEAKLNKKLMELQLINRVSKDIATSVDLESVLNEVANQVVKVSEAACCTIRLISEDDPNKLILKACQGIEIDKVVKDEIDKRRDIMGKAVESKLPFTVKLKESIITNTYISHLYEKKHGRYCLFNPIMVRDNIIGVMSSLTNSPPAQPHIELLTSLANSIAIAIDNSEAYDKLKESYFQTIQSLVSAVEAKDYYTENHSYRVSEYAVLISSEMGYDNEFLEKIRVTGLLHDIGKIGISDTILNKRGKLTSKEYDIIKKHPDIACKILEGINLDKEIILGIRHHHERYDGKGYPGYFKEESIPDIAYIISVADAFDAMTSKRPYKEIISFDKAVEELRKNKGTQFNPKAVDAFINIYKDRKDEIIDLGEKYEENPWETTK